MQCSREDPLREHPAVDRKKNIVFLEPYLVPVSIGSSGFYSTGSLRMNGVSNDRTIKQPYFGAEVHIIFNILASRPHSGKLEKKTVQNERRSHFRLK